MKTVYRSQNSQRRHNHKFIYLENFGGNENNENVSINNEETKKIDYSQFSDKIKVLNKEEEEKSQTELIEDPEKEIAKMEHKENFEKYTKGLKSKMINYGSTEVTDEEVNNIKSAIKKSFNIPEEYKIGLAYDKTTNSVFHDLNGENILSGQIILDSSDQENGPAEFRYNTDTGKLTISDPTIASLQVSEDQQKLLEKFRTEIDSDNMPKVLDVMNELKNHLDLGNVILKIGETEDGLVFVRTADITSDIRNMDKYLHTGRFDEKGSLKLEFRRQFPGSKNEFGSADDEKAAAIITENSYNGKPIKEY